MKKVPCSEPTCSNRRRHHESDEPRGAQYVDVPDAYEGEAYCSLECAIYGGALRRSTLPIMKLSAHARHRRVPRPVPFDAAPGDHCPPSAGCPYCPGFLSEEPE